MAKYLGESGLEKLISKIKTYHTGDGAIDVATDGKISLAINENDQVLSQTSDGLLSTLSIDYDKTDRVIRLLGIDSTVISSFDASEFIVDGMIQSAELIHNNPDTGETGEFLAITFNTEGGKTTTIYIDVTELVDVYTAGNGTSITDNEISVKIASGSESYLTVNSDGLALNGVSDAIVEAVNSETSRAEAAEEALEEAIKAAVAGESTTVVKQDSSNTHVTVTSSTSGTTTTYTISESNIASVSDIPTLSDLDGVGTVNASGSGDLTLSAEKDDTTVTITGSLNISEISASDINDMWGDEA